ncbi:putative non-specific serine/threonine protein kinase [Rosa chinensis]|uniref:Putative non-specific serine/threonine protein kinase n=1 Tax=Rosa chinensis TaxID=74649 RepID=A0A2P6Q9R8_ROSCH|nr:putative non-specific serine/threonine protein kinase [Rosa chinensis]
MCVRARALASLAGNRLTGSIPIEIGNISTLQSLVIQASGLTGPIPSNISVLKELTDSVSIAFELIAIYKFRTDLELCNCYSWSILTCRRITDLDGPEATFPPLDNMTKLKTLMLRNCNLIGELPTYLANLTELDM